MATQVSQQAVVNLGTSASPHNFTYTMAGTENFVHIPIYTGAGDVITGVTVDGVSATQLGKVVVNVADFQYLYGVRSTGFTSGAKTVSITHTGTIGVFAGTVGYSGIDQSATFPNAVGSNHATTGTNISASVLTTLDNCILVGSAGIYSPPASPGSNTSIVSGATVGVMAMESFPLAQTPTGVKSLAISWSVSNPNALIVAAIAPTSATVSHNLSLLGVGA